MSYELCLTGEEREGKYDSRCFLSSLREPELPYICLNCADKEEASRYTYHICRFEFYSCVSHSTGFSVAGDPHSFQYEIIII